MKSLWSIGLLSMLLILAACASEPDAETTAVEPEMTDMAEPTEAVDADALSGTWTGDWGPSVEHRNPVTVNLMQDGMNVTGTINPGDQDIQLTSGTFDPDTGMVMLEAQAEGRGGVLNYTIEGQVTGNTFSGTWTHENGEGTFSVMR